MSSTGVVAPWKYVTTEIIKFQITVGNIIQIVVTVIGLCGLLYQEAANQQRTQDKLIMMQETMGEFKTQLGTISNAQNTDQLNLTQVNDELKLDARRMDALEKHLENSDARESAIETEGRALDTSLQILQNSLKQPRK